ATGAMSTVRSRHTAALLSSGKVLVAGGITGTTAATVTASAEVYDPTAGTWSTTGAMATARYRHVPVIYAGKPLVIPGDGSTALTATVEQYAPTAGTWSVFNSLNTARWIHAATVLANGTVLVSGGEITTADHGAETAAAELLGAPAGSTCSAN